MHTLSKHFIPNIDLLDERFLLIISIYCFVVAVWQYGSTTAILFKVEQLLVKSGANIRQPLQIGLVSWCITILRR